MTVPIRPDTIDSCGGRVQDTIVVGVDGSSPSHAAVRVGASWAARTRGPLLLVHAVPMSPGDEQRSDRAATVAAEDLLERERAAVLSLTPGVEVETAVIVGDAMWAIAHESVGSHAVIVGSHKTGFLRGTSFGAGPLQLVAASTSLVVIVPATVDDAASGVVVGLDDSPDGVAALDAAIALAHERGDDLLIVRATSAGRPVDGGRQASTEDHSVTGADTSRDSDMLDRARDRARRLRPRLTVRSRLVTGAPAPALLRLSAHAALLVVGRSRAEDSSRVVSVGRVTHDVLLNLSTTTVVVPSRVS